MIIRAPIELHNRFLSAPQNFVRDMACIPLLSISPFFKTNINYAGIVSQYIRNPWDDRTRRFREDFACEHTQFPRFLHFDLAENRDKVGWAMCHCPHMVDRLKLPGKKKSEDAEMMRVPFIKFDAIGRIEVTKREELDYNMIIDIVQISAEKGFDIWLVTFDRFNSSTLMKMLKEMGFVCANLSIDRTSNYPVLDNDPKFLEKSGQPLRRKTTEGNYIAAMQSLKDTLEENRCEVPFDSVVDGVPTKDFLRFEIEGSEFDSKKLKVDHIPRVTNDMLQGMAGACYNCHNHTHDVDELSEEQRNNVDKFMQNYAYSDRGLSMPQLVNQGPNIDPFYLEYANEVPTGDEVLGL